VVREGSAEYIIVLVTHVRTGSTKD
jgi:hypothetical protein